MQFEEAVLEEDDYDEEDEQMEKQDDEEKYQNLESLLERRPFLLSKVVLK